MATTSSEARLKLVAENLARAALAEFKQDVQGAGTAAGGASVGFGKMVFAHGNLIASTGNARRGVNLIEHALQTLTTQAIGVPGPIGKIAQGLGLLGTGSLAVTGAIAGAGAIVLAWKLASAEADGLIASTDKLNQRWRDLVAQDKPMVAFMNQVGEAQDALTKAQEKFNSLNAFIHGPIKTPLGTISGRRHGTAGEIALAQSNVDAAQRVLDRLEAMRGDVAAKVWVTDFLSSLKQMSLGGQVAELIAHRPDFYSRGLLAGEAWNEAFLKATTAAQVLRFSPADLSPAAWARSVGLLRSPGFTAPTFGAEHLPPPNNPLESGHGTVFGATSIARFSPLEAGAKEDWLKVGSFIAQSFFQATQAIATGSPAGILGGAGSILGGASHLEGLSTGLAGGLGLAGLITSGLGGLFSLFDHSAERRHREMLKAMRDLRPVLEALRTTPIIISASGDVAGTTYRIQRRYDRDALDRGVGAEI